MNADSDRTFSVPSFFDPEAPIDQLLGNLPHWRQPGVTYFVTFRQADSVPRDLQRQWTQELSSWLAAHRAPHTEADRREFFIKFPDRMQVWLDNGYGSCLFGDKDARRIVDEAIRYFDGARYRLHGHVVAINHVHAIVTPQEGHSLSKILHSWKSFTAHAILKVPEWVEQLQRYSDSQPTHLWQKESFDHIVRSPESLARLQAYIAAHREAKGIG